MDEQQDAVLYEKIGARAVITLNRPHRLNAINDALPVLLQEAVLRAQHDADVRVILLQGAGKVCSFSFVASFKFLTV